MTANDRVSLTGRSGIAYHFTVFPLGLPLEDRAAVYAVLRADTDYGLVNRRTLCAFTRGRRDERREWSVLYVGQTASLKERFEHYDHDPDLARIRASHIAACSESSPEQRMAIERDLVQQYAPLTHPLTRADRTYLVETIIIEQRAGCPN